MASYRAAAGGGTYREYVHVLGLHRQREKFQLAALTADFLFGNAHELVPRAVVRRQLQQCHDTLQVHGGRRRSQLCAMCHTAGAEDRTTPPRRHARRERRLPRHDPQAAQRRAPALGAGRRH
jgi:hypothetical protein